MGLTAFPNGVSSFGIPVVGSGDVLTTGNVFFVDSGHTNTSDGNAATSPDAPAATIDAAIGKCTASNGDVIFVMPGHDENPTASITMDVAGVWIRGLGWGASRPTVTFGAAGASVAMSAAGTRITNILFDLGTVAATVTNCFAVTAADCIIEECETRQHATSQFTNIINVNASGTRTIIRNNNLQSLITAGASSGIYLDGCDDCQVIGNTVMGHFGAAGCIDNTTGTDEALQIQIIGNTLVNNSVTAGDLAISMDDAATGIMAHNVLVGGLALASNVEFGNIRTTENYVIDAVDVSGVILPAATAA